MSGYIPDEIEISSDDSDREKSDEENQVQHIFKKNMKTFLILGLESFIFQNIRNFYLFSRLWNFPPKI